MGITSGYTRLDATADLYVNVIADDVACATPQDHCNCAVAQAIKRAVGREDAAAVIFPSVAYVLMPTDRGTVRAKRNRGVKVREGQLAWHRFRIDPLLGKQILSFDETGEAAEGGYRFRAPTPSQTLKAKRMPHTTTRKPGSRGRIATAAPWRRSRSFRLTTEEPARDSA
jgi:hypothetical protein